MNKITDRTIPQQQTLSLAVASRVRPAIYVTFGLLLLLMVGVWGGTTCSTATAAAYPAKGNGTGADGKAQLPNCDPNWLVVASPNIALDTDSFFSDIEVLAANNIWAVGYYRTLN